MNTHFQKVSSRRRMAFFLAKVATMINGNNPITSTQKNKN